jgi:membrane-associated phospholipid phosphatase
VTAIGQVVRGLWREAWRIAGRHAVACGYAVTVTVVLAWMMAVAGVDRGWVQEFVAKRDPSMIAVAKTISWWGEMHLGPLLAVLVLALAGHLTARERWRLAACAGFLGMVTAGLTALALKILIGRPRPKLHLEDIVQGVSWHAPFHSFPSGHAAHWFGLVAAVAVLAPRWAACFGIVAVAVCWSRLYLEQHYFGDILGGVVLGGITGLLFGLAARRLLVAEPAGLDLAGAARNPGRG